jgi:hypothetical protein
MFCVGGVVYEHCIARVSSMVKSIIVTVPSVGNYSITAFSRCIPQTDNFQPMDKVFHDSPGAGSCLTEVSNI